MNDSSAELEERVTRLVAQVILAMTGRTVMPARDEALFEQYLDPVDMAALLLAIDEEFSVTLAAHEANRRTLGSVASIAELLERRLRQRP
jgi:hypothetical protein